MRIADGTGGGGRQTIPQPPKRPAPIWIDRRVDLQSLRQANRVAIDKGRPGIGEQARRPRRLRAVQTRGRESVDQVLRQRVQIGLRLRGRDIADGESRRKCATCLLYTSRPDP